MHIISSLAHAKINLFLHIIGKRNDGYHLLQSLMVKLSLADEITITRSNQLTCRVIDNFKIDGENIVLKAAKSLKKHYNIPNNIGAKITIKKNIPISAGLGGGSADAATTLQLLVKLWEINTSEKELTDLAKTIGADIPFCLQNKSAFVEGIGEILTPVNFQKNLFILLVNPNILLSTQDAYKSFNNEFTTPINNNSEKIWKSIYEGKNDLEIPIHNKTNKISQLLNLIKKQQGCTLARMSGSGSTCFGLFKSLKSAELAEQNIKTIHTKYWTNVENLEV